MNQQVKFVVKFMDWKPGDIADLPKGEAEHYIDIGTAKVHKPAAKKAKPPVKQKRPPNNRMAVAPITK